MSMPSVHSPARVVCLQIDVLCCARGKGGSESLRRVKTELMVQMTAMQHSPAHVLMRAAI